MANVGRRDLGKERFWRRMLRLWQRSRLSGRDFCGLHGLSEPSFYSWRREIARRDEECAAGLVGSDVPSCDAGACKAFVQVTVDDGEAHGADQAVPENGSSQQGNQAIDVLTAQGRIVRVRPGFDAVLLRRLLSVLEESAC